MAGVPMQICQQKTAWHCIMISRWSRKRPSALSNEELHGFWSQCECFTGEVTADRVSALMRYHCARTASYSERIADRQAGGHRGTGLAFGKSRADGCM